MKGNVAAMVAVIGGLGSAAFGQQPYYQGDPNYNGYGQYGNGQYDPNNPGYNDQGVYAPAPPPAPSYAYQTPPAPGPGYFWVDGYWNFIGGRYVWIPGYWALPPDPGEYWVAPRYFGGRFFVGFWGGGRSFDRGFGERGSERGYRFEGRPRQDFRPSIRSDFRNGEPRFDRGFAGRAAPQQGFSQSPRQEFRAPAQNGFRGGAGGNRGSEEQGHHGGRH